MDLGIYFWGWFDRPDKAFNGRMMSSFPRLHCASRRTGLDPISISAKVPDGATHTHVPSVRWPGNKD